MTMFKYLGYAAAGIVLGTSLPAIAAEKQRKVRVEYSDLNLANAKHRRTLDRRIERAIVQLCGTTDIARNMVEIQMVEACVAEARDDLAGQRAHAEAQAALRLASVTSAAERN